CSPTATSRWHGRWRKMTSTMQPWTNWEDYAAGLYAPRFDAGQVQESVKLLSDPAEFDAAAREMIREWPNAAKHWLNLRSGRKSWIGQAACCYHHGATSTETRHAWGMLVNRVQVSANEVAAKIADEFLGWRWP